MTDPLMKAVERAKGDWFGPPQIDPRDPDHTRKGIFVLHNYSPCNSGELPCVQGHPNRCEFPHARND